MADISNNKSFVGGIMLAAIGIVAGGALGAKVSILTGAFLASLSFLALSFLIFRGPELVEVRFVDEDTFGIVERFLIKRTINKFYIYLKRLGLEPPLNSPVIGTHSLPIAVPLGGFLNINAFMGITSTCCSSHAPDVSRFMRPKPYRKLDIAAAYANCWLLSLFKTDASNQMLYELRGVAQFLFGIYFCYAFADVPLPIPENSTARWANALLTVRNTCGDHFTDTVMAYALGLLRTANANEGESFDTWMWQSVSSAMLNTASRSSGGKANRAASILMDYKVISEEQVRRDATLPL